MMRTAQATVETAGYFGPAARPLFGWEHRGGVGPGAGTGIVFCSPLGYEAVPIHRTIRAAAAAAARRGCATLRFDYDGCGDSAGNDLDPERVPAWLDSIAAAIDILRSRNELARLCLWGFRAGSLLAAQSASQRSDIAALISSAPVLDGNRYLREQRALAAASGTPPLADELQEVAGFLTTAPTRAALRTLDVRRLAPAHCRRSLWLPRDDLPFDVEALRAWQESGIAVDVHGFSGFEAMTRDAHRTEIPVAMIDTALDWLLREVPAMPVVPRAENTMAATPAPLPVTMELPEGVRETVLQGGPAPRCFAVLTEPPEPQAPASAPAQPPGSPAMVLLLNAGSVNHIGPNRMHVELARKLAGLGMTAARIDLPGIGDAPGHPDYPDNHCYSRHALDDLRATLLELRQRVRPAALHIVGLCSGAYHALGLATTESGIDSVTIINPLTFRWREGMQVDVPESKVFAESARYQRRALEPAAWLKLLRGQVAMSMLLRVLTRRALQVLVRLGRAAGVLVGLGASSHLDRTLQAAAAHGVRMQFVIADSDPGLAMLLDEAPRTVRALRATRQLGIDVVANADHTFTHSGSRQQLLQLLVGQLAPARAP